MVNTFRIFSSLFLTAFIFLVGNGLLNTLVSVRMTVEGFATTTIGVILSSHFTGLLIGSFVCQRLIRKVGHIRAFAVFAALTTSTILLYGMYIAPWFWCLLRFSNGITIFGLFVVIESWLNECTESDRRGRVFSIYMTLMYMGIGIGQQLLNVADVYGQGLFILAGIVFSLCLIPVSTTEGVHPRLPETQPTSFMSLFHKVPLGILGCLASGMTNSAFFAMTPVYCNSIDLSLHQLSWIMSITVFCGLAAQWIAGTLSDRFDRTLVLAVIATAMTVVSGIMFIVGEISFWQLVIEMGLFGALAFTVYPISVARTHDVCGGLEAVGVSANLLFAYSIGASVSPFLVSVVMTLLDSPAGLFVFWGLNSGALAVVILYLRKRDKVDVVPVEEQVLFVPMKSTSPVVMALDQRTDGEVN
ncbi:MFS transporter [Desulfosarcina widdelii]|uniref:MFS transporter n=1 Tax=Desulfosarcina widdelii TaxID=947919 RepID=A0A5K7YZ32_9BACT|nr:MFS transporter [Desulfosarcina widdelii]BBO73239.1 MFS transporter [Desulfosarcina widdelii]